MRAFQTVFCIHLHKEKNLWAEEWKVNISKRELQHEKGWDCKIMPGFSKQTHVSWERPREGAQQRHASSLGVLREDGICKLLTSCLTLTSVMVPDVFLRVCLGHSPQLQSLFYEQLKKKISCIYFNKNNICREFKKLNNAKNLTTQYSSLQCLARLHCLCWLPARLTGDTILKLFCFFF